ncbi:hypothetical protein [Marinilactibacillus kalidii]|uniref:hypothetical protein n=1 Tax=Marinilactibacillus kalidii TaxID=2820274 RepID=UPI001ABE9BEE|nr:hypothetical protein [Marinilactibacillus kalidii]
MSVTIKRTVGSFSLLSMISVKMNDVVLEKLAPGESVTFELPNDQETIKLSTALSSKTFTIKDGQQFNVIRDNRMWVLRYIICLAFIIVAFLSLFYFPTVPLFARIIQLILLLTLLMLDIFLPKYAIKESAELSEREENWNSY